MDAARAIDDFIRDHPFEECVSNRMMRGAVERHFEIIGEAARHVSEPGKSILTEIPWKSVIGLRNIIAHEYGEIRHEKVWGICKNRLPELIAQLECLDIEHPPMDLNE